MTSTSAQSETRKRQRPEDEQDDPNAEPPNGMDVAVNTIHPFQQWVPVGFKTDASLDATWTTKPVVTDANDDDVSPQPELLMFLLDLSPSMAHRPIWDQHTPQPPARCAAEAVVDTLQALPAYLARTLTNNQHRRTRLAIAGFSGTAAWVDDDHCALQTPFDEGTRPVNWITDTTTEHVEENCIPLTDEDAINAYIAKWVAKTERVFRPASSKDRDHGKGTNIAAALLFAHKAVHRFWRKHGGSGNVFLLTDGVATVGATSAFEIRRTLDKTVFRSSSRFHIPAQFHTLMMGDDPDPAMLTRLMGPRGLLGYAKDNGSIGQGLDSILKIALQPDIGTMDMVMFTCFEDVETGARLSDVELTLYTQGRFVGDNFTALAGARMPNKYHDYYANNLNTPFTTEMAKAMVLRVYGFCAPNMHQRVRKVVAAHNHKRAHHDLLYDIIHDGHELLLDQKIPLSLTEYWSPRFLSQQTEAYLKLAPKPPDANQYDSSDRLYPTDGAAKKNTGIYQWIENGDKLRDEMSRVVGNSYSYADAMEQSQKYEKRAASSGYRSLAARCRAAVSASAKGMQDEMDDDYLEAIDSSETPIHYRSASAPKRHGSARHYVMSSMSQASTRD